MPDDQDSEIGVPSSDGAPVQSSDLPGRSAPAQGAPGPSQGTASQGLEILAVKNGKLEGEVEGLKTQLSEKDKEIEALTQKLKEADEKLAAVEESGRKAKAQEIADLRVKAGLSDEKEVEELVESLAKLSAEQLDIQLKDTQSLAEKLSGEEEEGGEEGDKDDKKLSDKDGTKPQPKAAAEHEDDQKKTQLSDRDAVKAKLRKEMTGREEAPEGLEGVEIVRAVNDGE